MTIHPGKIIANAVQRSLETMFPGYFAQAKHNHYRDFGWPDVVQFPQFFAMYQRNGMARASVEKTVGKTWQTNPEIWESEKPTESDTESDIRQRFADLRLWQRLADADRMSLVGGYAGVIFRFADSKRFREPVDTVPGGLMGLVEVIPAWAGQLTASSWDTDEMSETYGQPTMFTFNEASVFTADGKARQRAFEVHPDRVMIWSTDGTVYQRSALEPGYNALLDMEKISGAGGEGFYKNAKQGLAFKLPPGSDFDQTARAMGIEADQLLEQMDEHVTAWQAGFDKQLMLAGMEVSTLPITMPQPEEFFNVPLQSYAASQNIPLKILVGNQTGERASTEDQREWSQTNMSRRSNLCVPNIHDMLNRFERFTIIPERDWVIHWQDLTEASAAEKMERGVKMAQVNQALASTGELAYLASEIREVTGHEPLENAAIEGDEE